MPRGCWDASAHSPRSSTTPAPRAPHLATRGKRPLSPGAPAALPATMAPQPGLHEAHDTEETPPPNRTRPSGERSQTCTPHVQERGRRDRRQAPFPGQSQRPEASSVPRAQALRAPRVDPKCGLVGQAGQGPGANPLGQQSPGGGGAVPRLRLQVQLAAAGKSPAGSGPARSRVLTRGWSRQQDLGAGRPGGPRPLGTRAPPSVNAKVTRLSFHECRRGL